MNTVDAWLNKPYIKIDGLMIDRWSWVHLITGITIGLIVAWKWPQATNWKAHVMIFLLMIMWEIFEFTAGEILFKVETLTDKTWDLIIGMAGYYICYKLFIGSYRNAKKT